MSTAAADSTSAGGSSVPPRRDGGEDEIAVSLDRDEGLTAGGGGGGRRVPFLRSAVTAVAAAASTARGAGTGAGADQRSQGRWRQQRYSRVADGADSDGDGEGEVGAVQDAGNTNSNSGNNNDNNVQTVYDDDDEEDGMMEDIELGEGGGTSSKRAAAGRKSTRDDTDDEDDDCGSSDDDEDDDGTRINVVILDFCQKRFTVTVNPAWKVKKLKSRGAAVHKVPVDRQRLIYRGRMLSEDENTLRDMGIVEDDVIVHLFPKPRIVIKQATAQDGSNQNGLAGANNTTSSGDANGEGNGGGDDDDAEAGGASVPTIVLDPAEAERRSQILVLGSPDYVEAQNHVKLFSFMLLIISTIELLNLISVALGVPDEDPDRSNFNSDPDNLYTEDYGYDDPPPPPASDEDPIFSFDYDTAPYNTSGAATSSPALYQSMDPDNDANMILTKWGTVSWVDLFVSVLGVYVSLLGIKASNLNDLCVARQYLFGTFLVGVLWMALNFYLQYEVDIALAEEREENEERSSSHDHHHHEDHNGGGGGVGPDGGYEDEDDTDFVSQALSVMVLPGMVWIMCCLRAFQFQMLLEEAEEEAEERVQSEFGTTNALSQRDRQRQQQQQAVTRVLCCLFRRLLRRRLLRRR